MKKRKPIDPSKVFFWNCRCGAINHAPAIQTPDNVVVCYKCRSTFDWEHVDKVSDKRGS